MITRVALFAVCVCVVLTPAFAQDILPAGWRLATGAEASIVEADLNGDGIADKAVLVTNGDLTQLLVSSSEKKGFKIESLLTTICDPLDACAVKLVPPSTYRTVCGKGDRDCKAGEPEKVKVSTPTLSFNDENVQILFLFNASGVKRFWLSD